MVEVLFRDWFILQEGRLLLIHFCPKARLFKGEQAGVKDGRILSICCLLNHVQVMKTPIDLLLNNL